MYVRIGSVNTAVNTFLRLMHYSLSEFSDHILMVYEEPAANTKVLKSGAKC